MRLWEELGTAGTISEMLQNRHQLKGYYRLINNKKVEHEKLISMFGSYSAALVEKEDVVLGIQDTTELDYSTNRSRNSVGCMEYEHRKGLYLHTHLLVGGAGNVLGCLSQRFLSRSLESLGKGKSRKYASITDKESVRWWAEQQNLYTTFGQQREKTFFSITDREGDITELLCEPRAANMHYIIRSKNNRKCVGKSATLVEAVGVQPVSFTYVHKVSNKKGEVRQAALCVRYCPLTCQPPYRKDKKLPPVSLWVVEAKEENPPAGVAGLCWRLLCSMPIDSIETAKKMIAYYTLRWLIERFHYVLKQGRKVEDLQIQTQAALKNAIVLQSWIAIQICALSYESRSHPDKSLQEVGFEKQDYQLVYDYLTTKKKNKLSHKEKPTIADFVELLAILGGSTLPGKRKIGIVSLWKGLQTFSIIKEAYSFASQRYG